MKSKKYRRAVFVVVYHKKNKKIKYLILKRKLHWKGWEFPKGGLKEKEKILDAVKRELKEETKNRGYNIKLYKKGGKYNYDKFYEDRPGIRGQTYKLYSAEIKNKKITLDKKEHSRYKWVNFNKALKKLTWPNQKKCLKIANKNLRK